MRRQHRLHLEMLEGRALLSPVAGLSSSLTIDHSVYQAGQPIHMTFTETNRTGQPIQLAAGPSTDGFTVSQNGRVIWTSNAGPDPMYIMLVTLQPGRSFTVSATWNGVPNTGGVAASSVDTGSFVVTDQLDPTGARATFQIVPSTPQPTASPNPPAPVSSPTPPSPSPNPSPPTPAPSPTPTSPAPQPNPVAPAVTLALTTDHPTYRRGQPIRMKLVLTDVGDQAVSLLASAGVASEFTVSRDAKVVWHSKPGGPALQALTLQPGQSLTRTAVWNARPRHGGLTRLTPGIYTIQASEGGYTGTATVRIV